MTGPNPTTVPAIVQAVQSGSMSLNDALTIALRSSRADLPATSLPFRVELSEEMIGEWCEPFDDATTKFILHWRIRELPEATIRATIAGRHELGFEEGRPHVGVETDHDRVMLILALGGER